MSPTVNIDQEKKKIRNITNSEGQKEINDDIGKSI